MQISKATVNGIEHPCIDLAGITPAEWDEYRKSSTRIGGSDVGTILGLNKYSDAITLFFEKTGFIQSSFIPSEASEGGHLDEAAILHRLEFWDGVQWAQNVRKGHTYRKIEKPEKTFLPVKYEWLALNVDGIISYDEEYPNLEGVAEAKKIGSHVMSQYPGGCPPSYIGQTVTYMIGLEMEFARIALLEDGVRLHVRTIDREMEEFHSIKEQVLEKCPRFYNACIDGRTVLSTTDDRKAQTELLMEVIAEYSDVLKITHLSKSALDNLSAEMIRRPIIKDTSLDVLLLDYSYAEMELSISAKKEAELKNRIIEYLIKNNAAGIEGSSFRATYNKRFTFKNI